MSLDQKIADLQNENIRLKAEIEKLKSEIEPLKNNIPFDDLFFLPEGNLFLTALIQCPEYKFQKISLNSALQGKKIEEALLSDCSKAFVKILDQVCDTGKNVFIKGFNLQTAEEAPSENKLFFDLSFIPLKASGGTVENIAVIGYNVSKQIKHKNLLEQILKEFPVGMALHEGPEFKNILINKGYYQFAYGKGDIINKNVAEVWPEIAHEIIPRLTSVYESGEPFHATDEEFLIERGKGPEKAWFSYSYLPFREDGRNISGILVWSIETSRYVLSQQKAEKTGEELQKRTAQLEATINSYPNGYLVFDNNNNILHMNQTARDVLALTDDGKKLSVFKRIQLLEVETPDDKPLTYEMSPLIRAQNGETVHNVPLKIKRKNNTIWLSVSASPIISSNGEKYGAVIAITDITSAKATEIKIREQEMELRQLADSMPHMIWVSDSRGNHQYFNRRWYEYSGLKPGTVNKDEWLNILHPDDRTRALDLAHYSLKSGQPYTIEYRLKRGSDNTYQWFLGRAVPVYNRKGEINRWYGTCTNIQGLKETEQALLEIKERYRLVNKATHDIIWDWNLTANTISWNEALEEAIGKSRNELPKDISSWHMHIHPDDREQVIQSIHQAIDAGKESWSSEYRFGPPEGPWRTYFDRGFIACNENGKAYRMIGSMLDLTERKESEKALQESQELLKNVLEVLPVGVFVADNQGKISLTNTAAEKIWGGAKHVPLEKLNEYKGWWRDSGKMLQPMDWAFARAFLKGESSKNEEIDIVCFDGTNKTILNFASPVYNENHQIISAVAVTMDISSRIKTEEALSKSEERFRTLADNISQLAWMADEKGNIFWYNKRWFEYTGTTLEEVKGWGWKKVHHPDHVERVTKKIQQTWNSGERWEDIFPLRRHDGKYRWFLSRAVPVRNNQGKLIRWFGTNTDVTNQRDAEIQLKKAYDLLETILYILAHDLKGPVGNLQMAADLLNSMNDITEKIKLLNMIKPQINRMETTIAGVTNILQAQKLKDTSIRNIDIEKLIQELLPEFGDNLRHHELMVNCSYKKSVNYVEPFLTSILRNLISNAIKYRREKVKPKIKVSSHIKNEYVLLSIEDNGMGINLEKHRDKLFKPFSRLTSQAAEGTGIGLYLIKTLIEKNGGYIDVESTPGEGTTFYCYLREYEL